MMACVLLFSIPITIAALTLFSAEVFSAAVALGVLLARLLLAGALGRERQLLGDVDVSSMSSLELRSAVLVISVWTSWSVYENANAPRELERGLTVCAPAAGARCRRTCPLSLSKILSKAWSPYLKPPSSSFLRVVDVLLGEAGRGRRGIGRVQRRDGTEGQEGRVEDLRRAQGEAGLAPGVDGAELDPGDAAASLVLERAELKRLLVDQSLVADQVELIGPRHHVIGPPCSRPSMSGT